MDHAEVTDRIAVAVAAPGGLSTLVADASAAAAAVREHVRGCAECSAEWRAWSVVSVGLAMAAPDDLTMRPAARDTILGSILSRPRATPVAGVVMSPPVTVRTTMTQDAAPSHPDPMPTATPVDRPTVVAGGRTGRTAGMSSAASRAARRAGPGEAQPGSWFKWVAVAAAAAVVLFVAGAAFGRPLGLGGGEPAPTSGVPRVLAITAGILQGQGYSLAQLETPAGAVGGFVAVSPGSGNLTVVSQALVPPPAGARYVCLMQRGGTSTPVGYMKFDGDLAFWAGPVTDPVDIGLRGDVFVVQLDSPGSAPALTGTF